MHFERHIMIEIKVKQVSAIETGHTLDKTALPQIIENQILLSLF